MPTKLSVLIPYFNHIGYIEILINNINEQDESVFELLIVNDGSLQSQDPEKIISNVKKNMRSGDKIKYICQDNIGLAATLNKLIELSNGDVITVIASDDLLTSESLRSRIKILEENARYDAVIGDAQVIDEKGEIICDSAMADMFKVDIFVLKMGQEYAKKELIYHWGVPGPCLMIRRTVYEDIGNYDERLRVEDRDFYLRLFAKKNILFMTTPVAKYRVHASNTAREENKTWIYQDIALSNYRNSHLYNGAEKLYLLSYWLDHNVYFLSKRINIYQSLSILLRLPAVCLRAALRLLWKIRVSIHMIKIMLNDQYTKTT